MSSSSRESFGLRSEKRYKFIDHGTGEIFSKYLHPHALWATRYNI